MDNLHTPLLLCNRIISREERILLWAIFLIVYNKDGLTWLSGLAPGPSFTMRAMEPLIHMKGTDTLLNALKADGVKAQI